MKILYFVSIDEKNKTGLFNATHERIKTNANKFIYDIYNVNFYDGFLLKVLKILLGKKILKKEKDYFIHDGIKYNNVYIKETILGKVLNRFGIDILLYFKFLLTNKKRIKQFNLISAHWGHHPGSISYWIVRLFKIPYVLTSHGSDIHTLPNENKGYKKVILRNLQNASRNIFVSNYLLNEAKKIGYNSNHDTVIYNGVDLENFHPVLDDNKEALKKELMVTGKVIGYIGNLVYVKGVDRIPNILKKVIEKEKDISLLIVGDGELRDSVINEADIYNIKTYFMGKVAPTEVKKYISMMDIMILPSRNEGLGCVLLEAQACGIPVIGSNNGGIPEAIFDKNCIVKEDELFEEKFARKIEEILNSVNDSAVLGRYIEENFDWGKGGELEYSLYKEIIEMKNMMQ
ncbi:glycosyltransferase [Bacillus mycoides]|uniref:glycosyltransferase n=1 Tax=Bacillus mycoides TaxID=1405 RepID=UPI000B4A9598|nr:glycosyltransferase [Bacillus mycoides]